jgi:hypothetical protein
VIRAQFAGVEAGIDDTEVHAAQGEVTQSSLSEPRFRQQ